MDVRRHPLFDRSLRSVRDLRAISKIALRLERLADGNFGDFKTLGDSVYEMRIDHGPGYRIYYAQRGRTIVVLLCGGDKSSQTRDILVAKRLAKELKD
ncbi:type II toxin-antitoxin system RelE/ParE family toxin [Rhizobium sp. FKL33]|uniref:type II toxin-antitoxin system RelE/ParE family toxin n=1 Tax=Rhizobium sp. FKL33 TaxID=2562307 RepID=UPI0010BFD031|nr:type II toxin-antitoxin system RelE/ParE family toxin [Rhizobium sp. FKL33]